MPALGVCRRLAAPLFLTAMLAATAPLLPAGVAAAGPVTVGGRTYVDKGLVAAGRLPADLRDKFGETF